MLKRMPGAEQAEVSKSAAEEEQGKEQAGQEQRERARVAR
jgi:hypothetical protein